MVLRAVRQLVESNRFDQVVLSTDSEIIARTCMDEKVAILRRPLVLAGDDVGSIPVFQHIVDKFPCDIHLNYNCNFPVCPFEVFDQAIQLCESVGESLSDPYAVWAQKSDCLQGYGDPFRITATKFSAPQVHSLDVHTMDDLLEVHRFHQGDFEWNE